MNIALRLLDTMLRRATSSGDRAVGGERADAIERQTLSHATVGEYLDQRAAGSSRRLDAAHLFRLALEQGSAGARYHGVAEEGVPFRDIASVIGRHLNLPVVSKSQDEAADHFGWFAHFAALDNPASSKLTQERLGWRPKQLALIPDLNRARYFETDAKLQI